MPFFFSFHICEWWSLYIREIIRNTIKLENFISYLARFDFDEDGDLYCFILFILGYVIGRGSSSSSIICLYDRVEFGKNIKICK